MDDKIHKIAVGDLKPAPFNPLVRTDLSHIKDLVSSIRVDGFLRGSILTITKDNFIADGHRRWRAAIKAGLLFVPCVYTDLPLDDAFRLLNSNRLEFAGLQIMRAYADGMKNLPKSSAGEKVRRLVNKYGMQGVELCNELRVSPTAVLWAENICTYTGLPDSDALRVLRWMVENKMNKMVRYFMESDYPADIILTAISGNKKLEFKK